MTKIKMDRQYQTRDGRKVRLLCVDGPFPNYPVLGYMAGNTKPCEWAACGEYVLECVGPNDLVPVPEYRAIEGRDYWYVKNSCGQSAIYYYFDRHPNPKAAAEAECKRLNEGGYDD